MESNILDITDQKLIEQILEGDINKFKFIIKRHKMYMASIIAKYVSSSKIEELSQEAFVQAYNSLASFKNQGKFTNWLAQISRRVCFDYWKKEYKKIANLESFNF